MACGSPFLRSLDLGRHGLEWLWPPVDLAHPLDDGDAGVMVRSLERTVAGLGSDGEAWRRLFGSSATAFESLNEDLVLPIQHFPRHPIRLARFGPRRWRRPRCCRERSAPRAPARCSPVSPRTRSAH